MREKHYDSMILWYSKILPLLCYDSMGHDTWIVWGYETMSENDTIFGLVLRFCLYLINTSIFIVFSYCPAFFSSFVFSIPILFFCLICFVFWVICKLYLLIVPLSLFPLEGQSTTRPQDQRTTGAEELFFSRKRYFFCPVLIVCSHRRHIEKLGS